MNYTLADVLGDDQLSVLDVRKHSASKKVFNVDLSDETTVLVSIAKGYDAEGLPLFMNQEGKLTPGWRVENGWLFGPGTGEGIVAERA